MMKSGGLLLIFLASIFTFCHSRIIELDTQSTDLDEFFEISCDYAESPADFGNFGSNCAVAPEDIASIGDSTIGFWNPCKEVRQISYYGGMLPSPKSIMVRVYWNDTQGTSSLKLTGQTSPLTSENDTVLIEEFSMPSQGWNEFVVDLTAHANNLFVFTYELSRTANRDTILIDKVSVDLGEDVPEPTPDLPTTTPSIIDDGVVALDTENDLIPEWTLVEQECIYSFSHDDLANAWGCPANLEEDGIVTSGIEGYWSPCQHMNCSLEFDGSSLPLTKFIAIQAYVKGLGAELIIYGKESLAVPDFRELHRVSGSDQGIISRPIGYSLNQDYKLLKFTLIPNGHGYVLLDKIFLAQEEMNLPDPSTHTPRPETTLQTEATEATTETTPSGTRSPLESQQAIYILLIFAILKYFL